MGANFTSTGTVDDELRGRQIKLVSRIHDLAKDDGELIKLEADLRSTSGLYELADAVRLARLELRTGAVNGILNHFDV